MVVKNKNKMIVSISHANQGPSAIELINQDERNMYQNMTIYCLYIELTTFFKTSIQVS